MAIVRRRKSPFVKLFDKTPEGVVCPHFYELVLSNGCPFDCQYCYLKLTFRGKTEPTLFDNDWSEVERQLERIPTGVFSTGELADSLAIEPPLLEPALDYFSVQQSRHLLLLTKSANTKCLERRSPSPNIIVSFSVNSSPVHARWEKGTPPPTKRLEAAARLRDRGWRVRIRIDPVVLEDGFGDYRGICEAVRDLSPEMVTVGTLRHFPGLLGFAPRAPRRGLEKAPDGRLRYGVTARVAAYQRIAEWLGFQPALCKETQEIWRKLAWEFAGCNCTP